MRAPTTSSWRAFAARFAIAVVVAFVLTSASIGTALWYASAKFGEVDVIDLGEVLADSPDSAQPANYLIIGSDTRAFVDTDAEAEAFGSADEQTGQRSDTILVVHVDPDAGSARVLSFPRDLWVDIPGRGEAKINAAFNDGPEGVIDTIQTNFDVPIHHYIEVDFAGFESIVDAIGSIDVYFPTPARDEFTGLDVPEAGCVALDGAGALAYVRSRHYEYYDADRGTWRSDPRADIGRIARQQYFMRSLADTAIGKGARNPFTAKALLDQTVPNLRVDDGLELADVLALVNAFQNLDPEHVPMATLPTTVGSVGGQSVLFLEEDAAEPLLEAMRSFGGPTLPPFTIPDVDPADVTVRVSNGTGQGGAAGRALDALTALGFVGAGAGDADSFRYDTTEIRYAPGDDDEALFVLFHTGLVGRLVEVDEVPDGADVELVIGADFEGISSPAPVSPDGSTAATTTAPSTTTTTAVPIAPGDPGAYGLPEAIGEDGLPLVGCPEGT